MTLVARFFYEDHPLLLADLLLTGVPLPDTEVILPARESFTPTIANVSIRVPRCLSQKIVLFGDDVVFGWAGNRQIAEDVIGELFQLGCKSGFEVVLFINSLQRMKPRIAQELGLTGYFMVGDELFSFGCGESYAQLPTNRYGLVGLLGSGMRSWTKRMGRINWDGIGSASNSRARSVKAALVFSSLYINSEVISSQSLHEHVGGGCQIAVRSNGRFIKYDDVLYVCWIIYSVKDEKVELMDFPLRAFHYLYCNDVLLIRTYEPSWDGALFESSLFAVPPIYREVTPEELATAPVPTFNAKVICITAMVNSQWPHTRPLTMIQFPSGGTPWVQFEEHEGMMDVCVDGSFYDSIAKTMRGN